MPPSETEELGCWRLENRRVWAPGWRVETFHRLCVLGANPVAAAQAALHASDNQPTKPPAARHANGIHAPAGPGRPAAAGSQLQCLRQGERGLILRHSRKATPNVLSSTRGTNLEAVSHGGSGSVQPPVRSAKHRFLPDTQDIARPSVLACRWEVCIFVPIMEGNLPPYEETSRFFLLP